MQNNDEDDQAYFLDDVENKHRKGLKKWIKVTIVVALSLLVFSQVLWVYSTLFIIFINVSTCSIDNLTLESRTKSDVETFKKMTLLDGFYTRTRIDIQKSGCFMAPSPTVYVDKDAVNNNKIETFFSDFRNSMHKQGYKLSDLTYGVDPCGQELVEGSAKGNSIIFDFSLYEYKNDRNCGVYSREKTSEDLLMKSSLRLNRVYAFTDFPYVH